METGVEVLCCTEDTLCFHFQHMLLYTCPQVLTRVAATAAAAAVPAGARDTYIVLLRGIIGCSGPQPDAELVDGSAMALTSTSYQHPEYESYEDLRNSMIEVSGL
jgi:hypothetical protein